MAEQAILAGEGVEVLSDSTYAIKCISLGIGWEKRRDQKRGPIRNLESSSFHTSIYNRIKAEARLTMSAPTSAPKATSSPIAWPCSPCRANRRSYANSKASSTSSRS